MSPQGKRANHTSGPCPQTQQITSGGEGEHEKKRGNDAKLLKRSKRKEKLVKWDFWTNKKKKKNLKLVFSIPSPVWVSKMVVGYRV